eukprot:3767852-Rhodomonas_salina.1
MGLAAEDVRALFCDLAGGSLRSVTELDLSNNGVGDAGCSALADAFRNSTLASLTTLRLSGCGMHARGLGDLLAAVSQGH